MMIPSLIAFVAVFQVAAGDRIVWQIPAEPQASTEAVSKQTPSASGESMLPDWARQDPYAWERSQCHPALRGAEPMDHCQVRVRNQLKAVLGDRLPAGLQPEGISSCRQVSDGAGGYQLTCSPQERTLSLRNAPAPEICDQRPRALAGGGVTFERTCRPENAPGRAGLSVSLSGPNR